MLDDIILCFWYIMSRESSLNKENERQHTVFVNYPQWLVATSMHGWKKMEGMSASDRSALYPLNVTRVRLKSVVHNRGERLKTALKMSKKVINKIKISKEYELQIAVLIESNVWVTWSKLSDHEKDKLYLKLWVGFSGTLWRTLEMAKANNY